MNTSHPRRKGPVPGQPTIQVSILIPPDLAEWGKHRPEKLSALIRRLLEQERKRIEREERTHL